MELSRKFAECLGLISSRLRRVLELADRQNLSLSMLMLGEGAFSVVQAHAAVQVAGLMRRRGLFTVVSRIHNRGARLV